MKRYKLLKDLPTFHAGDIFILDKDGRFYLEGDDDGKYCGMAAAGHGKGGIEWK